MLSPASLVSSQSTHLAFIVLPVGSLRFFWEYVICGLNYFFVINIPLWRLLMVSFFSSAKSFYLFLLSLNIYSSLALFPRESFCLYRFIHFDTITLAKFQYGSRGILFHLIYHETSILCTIYRAGWNDLMERK